MKQKTKTPKRTMKYGNKTICPIKYWDVINKRADELEKHEQTKGKR